MCEIGCKFTKLVCHTHEVSQLVDVSRQLHCYNYMVLSGSAWMPVWSMTYPRNLTDALLNSHFSALSVTLTCSTLLTTARSRALCSSWLFPNTNTLSIWQTTPSRPAGIGSKAPLELVFLIHHYFRTLPKSAT